MKKFVGRYTYSNQLIRQFVKTDFKVRYQNSILGYLWTLLRPLFLFAILYVVFVKILGTGKNIDHPGVYILLGIVLWNYFVEVTSGSVSAIVNKRDMMRKANFPRYVIIIAVALSALINLVFNFIIVGIFMFLGHTQVSSSAVLFPLLIVELFVFSLAIGFLLSALYVKYRDVNFIWEVVVQGAFFAIPIMYAFSFVTSKSLALGKVFMCNPLTQLMQDARAMLISPNNDTVHSIFGSYWAYLIPLLIVVGTSWLAVVYFRRRSPYFAEEV